ncbi:hypothetical protein QAD02_020282 [Eretmocerus hayati]|uniref:Uncharacterized protein n=1 Tax=Eretmocerus hayati TaxID=131215 RepID=A0ACC2PLL9_9HYME|nr:hypothetical protein QAD02_020282 [Eretmocerus hayati]
MNLDTTKAEFAKAIQDALPDGESEEVTVKALRPAYRGIQLAVSGLPVSAVKAVLHKGHIKIKWVNATIRKRLSALRYSPISVVADCKQDEKGKPCFNCRVDRHIVAAYNNPEKCL